MRRHCPSSHLHCRRSQNHALQLLHESSSTSTPCIRTSLKSSPFPFDARIRPDLVGGGAMQGWRWEEAMGGMRMQPGGCGGCNGSSGDREVAPPWVRVIRYLERSPAMKVKGAGAGRVYDHGRAEEAIGMRDGGVPTAVNELTHCCCLCCRLATLRRGHHQ